MINALVGPSQNVNGRIIAIVVRGPMPGSTPIAVPSRHPRKQSAMFCHESAIPKPIAMLLSRLASTSVEFARRFTSEHRRPQRNRHFQYIYEYADNGQN